MRSSLLITLLAMVACSAEPDEALDMTPSEGACDDLPAAWDRLARENFDCEQDSDCVVFGGTGTCECAPQMGIHVIHRRALAEARGYLERFESDECAALRARTAVCDEPEYHPVCQGGFCSFGTAGCCFLCDDASVDEYAFDEGSPEPTIDAGSDGPDHGSPGPTIDAGIDGPDHGSPGPVIDAGPIPDAALPVDAAVRIDGGGRFDPNACDACAVDEICVQFFDGDCGGGQPRCVAATPNCRAAECTAECEAEICDAPFGRCRDVPGCDGAVRGALRCYGS